MLLTVDNHNSVNGIREFARAKGAAVDYAPLTRARAAHRRAPPWTRCSPQADPARANLFAFPAQSNFSGVKHPLELIDAARDRGWDVLLDAAAFVPTNRLDLRAVTPDFVTISFYKMFGYPTGVGCLLVRNADAGQLQRPWFAGGTVNFATVQGRRHVLSPREAGFEDGTLNYLSIPAVRDRPAPSRAHRHRHDPRRASAASPAGCSTELLALRHSNGRPMVRIYGPATTTHARRDGDDELLRSGRPPARLPARRGARRAGSASRCGPAASAIRARAKRPKGLTEDDMRAGLAEGADMTLPRFLQIMQHRGGKSAGAIRVSLGLASNFADVERFLQFAAGFRDQTTLTIGEVTFDIESCRVIRDGS